ncbi:MAG: iron-sulfur cluster insertion protein ErpA [Bdellovibrionales bacterium]
MVQITETAAKKISALRDEEGQPAHAFLRVSVKRGGCSGFSYKLAFDQSSQDNDKTIEMHNEKIVIDSQSLLYLMGMTLDYEGGLNGKGFIFNNPNATKNCGCGSSFAV